MIAHMFQAWKGLNPLIKVGFAVVMVAFVAFGAWTITPLFVDNRVEEDFPVTASQPAPSSANDTTVKSADAAVANAADAMTKPADAAAANAADAMTKPADVAAANTAADAMTKPEGAAAETAAESAAPTEPVALSVGNFTRIDSLHAAEGTATIYQLPDGSHLLRLEEFNATNGPDLFIGLSGHPEPRDSAELHNQGYFELERLKGNQGNQNYEIPADLDLSQYQSVVIYCKAFSVVFSTAELVTQ
ncbi:MAG: DM13 domain-containing protein [Chloroflexales bacterium]|nr:DM13 domain-containing protein [Chloroflexales bacterium]